MKRVTISSLKTTIEELTNTIIIQNGIVSKLQEEKEEILERTNTISLIEFNSLLKDYKEIMRQRDWYKTLYSEEKRKNIEIREYYIEILEQEREKVQ